MLQELADIDPQIEFRRLVLSEAGKVVANSAGSALNRTRAAKVASIRRRHDARTHVKFNGKLYNLKWRYHDDLWAQIVAFRKERLGIKLASRGLAKQSWMHAAIKMAQPFDAPDYVMFANYKGRIYPEDIDVKQYGDGRQFTVEVRNNSPLVKGAQMPRAMALAIMGRTGYFMKNMEHGVFRTLASRAKAYPGIWTSPVPPPADKIEL